MQFNVPGPTTNIENEYMYSELEFAYSARPLSQKACYGIRVPHCRRCGRELIYVSKCRCEASFFVIVVKQNYSLFSFHT